MSSFLWRGQYNRRLFNQTLTPEQYALKQERIAANRAAKQQKAEINSPVKTFLTGVFNNVKKFFSRGKH